MITGDGKIVKERESDKWTIIMALFPIIILIIGITGTWYVSNYRIDSQEQELNEIKVKTNDNCLKINTLEIKLDYIVEGVKDIQRKLSR